MPVSKTPDVNWYRSGLCSGGDCVEVAVIDDTSAEDTEAGNPVFLMRNSTDPERVLRLTAEEWSGFISFIKSTTGPLYY